MKNASMKINLYISLIILCLLIIVLILNWNKCCTWCQLYEFKPCLINAITGVLVGINLLYIINIFTY